MIKSKNRIIGILFIIILCLCAGGSILSTNTTKAYAESNKFRLQYSYNGSCNGIQQLSGTGYDYAPKVSASTNSAFIVYVYNSSNNGVVSDVPIGGNFKFSSFVIETTLSSTLTISNSFGAIYSNSGTRYNFTLTEGNYTARLTYKWSKTTKGATVNWNYVFTTSFTVDWTNPTISGASTSTIGKYVNTNTTVTASDSGSGLKGLFVKTPSAGSYSNYGSSYTVSASGTNGLYRFYALDNGGNNSGDYYVYLDTVKPTGRVLSGGSVISSGSFITNSFSYSASDTGSGLSYCQILKPNSSWQTYTAGTVIQSTSGDGAYSFRCYDVTGNCSDTLTIYLDTTKPVGVLYGGNTIIPNGGGTNASSIKFVASDNLSGINNIYIKTPSTTGYAPYVNGNGYTENGTYSFYCTDKVGLTSITYTIKLDNVTPTLTLSKGSWGGTIGDSFQVVAADSLTTVSLYYKKPNSSSFLLSATNMVSIPKTESDGEYSFYAIDALGNRTETKTVNLYVQAPIAQIIMAEDSNKVCIIWTDGLSTGKLNGNDYVNNTWIRTEGNYTFVLTSDAGRSRTYTFNITHYYKVDKIIEPTCLDGGHTVYKCISCDSSYNADEREPFGHSYRKISTASTCTEQGYTTYTCTRCGHTYTTDYLELKNHEFGEWYVYKAETCTNTGLDRRECKNCDYYEERDREALGHSYKLKNTDSTCTEQGFTTYTCSRCGQSYIDNYKGPLGHSYGNWYIVKLEDCLEDGLQRHDCTRCQYYEEQIRRTTGHNYEEKIIEPTCLEGGYTKHICSHCGEGYIDNYVDALGHDYIETLVKPTCTEKGYVDHTCSRCGYTYQTDFTSASGHSYTEQTVFATCTESGGIKHFCVNCGYYYITETEKALRHDYTSELTLKPTCTECGERHFMCKRCQEEYVKEIPATGHEYEIDHAKTENGVTTRTYVCPRCGDKFEQDLGAQYEHVSNYVEFLFNEYSPYMIWVFLATAGVWSIAMGVCFIIAKKNEDKEKARRMIVNYCIGLVVIFGILVACPYLVRGIAFLVS